MHALPALPSACAAKLKVLADATRLAVVELLLGGPRHVAEINEVLDLEQSLLSHHLKVLRKAGLVDAHRKGKLNIYRLAPGVSGVGLLVDLGCCRLSFEQVDNGHHGRCID
jgi:ArsR family transcriptional regulator